ncbi:hypothetical protein ASD11_01070 [Aeromicrobium sp. Root495]|uniref:alpha/beta fold hydrolase n=1 Tax=Aeromicrobium sp. Root495 TaxID=1736550 RepID=UPI0006F2CAE0|nr:alpha/beta fold hydrolase [Aeromicrobium sp. Root495]KQY58288.1 hypothetical protein ASD11_01070 [Aeromicrobium sp. Root495]
MSTKPTDLPPDLPGLEHRYADVNGVTLHYVEGGTPRPDAPSLVLVHGWPQHFLIWRDVLADLVVDHHVIALDLRGHGWSSVPAPGGDAYDKRTLAADVEALVEHLGLDRPVLVGHDWGAFVSLLVASRRPQLVRGVVAVAIIAPWAAIPVKALHRFGYQLVAAGPWGRFAHQGLDQRFLRTVYKLGAGRGPRLADTEVYLERYRDRDRARAGVAMYRRFLTAEVPASLRKKYVGAAKDVPIVMVPGIGDGVLTPDLVEGAAVLPNVTMEVVDGAGHWVPEQQHAVLVEKIRRFLAERL